MHKHKRGQTGFNLSTDHILDKSCERFSNGGSFVNTTFCCIWDWFEFSVDSLGSVISKSCDTTTQTTTWSYIQNSKYKLQNRIQKISKCLKPPISSILGRRSIPAPILIVAWAVGNPVCAPYALWTKTKNIHDRKKEKLKKQNHQIRSVSENCIVPMLKSISLSSPFVLWLRKNVQVTKVFARVHNTSSSL